jgi:hypothetical protein
VAQTAAALTTLRSLEGRPSELGELEITITPPQLPDADTARRYADLGVHRLVLQPDTKDTPSMTALIEKASKTLLSVLE